ncbi:hypothetical protein ACOMHN_044810 [Nucella lapillus]
MSRKETSGAKDGESRGSDRQVGRCTPTEHVWLPEYPISGVSLLLGDASAKGSPGPVRGAPDSTLKNGPIERGALWGKGNPPISIGFSMAPKGETGISRNASLVAVVRGEGSEE